MNETPSISEDMLAAVSREILANVFSIMGRLAALSHCRSQRTNRYYHPGLLARLGQEEMHSAMAIAHEQVWRNWLLSSLDHQRRNLLLYLQTLSKQLDEILRLWQNTQPFLAFIPDSALKAERALFTTNVLLLLRLFSSGETATLHCEMTDDPVLFLLRLVRAQYADPALSLKLLSDRVHLSERHVGRLFHNYTAKLFAGTYWTYGSKKQQNFWQTAITG